MLNQDNYPVFFKSILLFSLSLLLLFLCFNTSAMASQYFFDSGNINFFIGQKFLDKDDWAPVEKQRALGISIDFQEEQWPLSIVLEFFHSYDEARLSDPQLGHIEVKGETDEFNLGFRKIFSLSRRKGTHPFIDGGISWYLRGKYTSKIQGLEVSDSDEKSIGLWGGGGIYWVFKNHLNIGFKCRYSNAKLELFDNSKAMLGGIQVGGLVGYHW